MKSLSTTLFVLLVTGLSLSACQSSKNPFNKRKDGSLEYQQSQKLPPIELPINQPSYDFIPIFPTPSAGENTLPLTNESGTRYELPRPPSVIQ